jgi:hypothetical protein
MDTIIEMAAGGIEGAGVETATLVVAAYLVVRWLWLGIRADLTRWRGRTMRHDAVRDPHEEAFERGMRRLLADLEARPEPELTAFRRAA